MACRFNVATVFVRACGTYAKQVLQVEGQMNERICATALFYLDSENVTDSHLSFRMQTSAWLSDSISTGQDNYNWLERVFGTRLGHGGSCIQNYGDVKTCEGRVLAFPNV
jgi:hypothetical protein